MGGGSGLNNEPTNNFVIASFSDLTFDEYTTDTEKYDNENKDLLETLLGDDVETLRSLGAIEGSAIILTQVITKNTYSQSDFIILMRNALLNIVDAQRSTLFVRSNNFIYKLSAERHDVGDDGEIADHGFLAGFVAAMRGNRSVSELPDFDIINFSNKPIFPGFTGYPSNVNDAIQIRNTKNIYDKDFRDKIVNENGGVNDIERITISYENDSSTGNLKIESVAFTNTDDSFIYNGTPTGNDEWKMTNIMIIPDLDPDNKRDLDIKGYAFSDNSSLKKFEIVPDFKSIDLASGSMGEGNVFSNCSELEYVTIGKSEEGITLGESTFMNCNKLKTLIIDSKIVTADSEYMVSNYIPDFTLSFVDGFNDDTQQLGDTIWSEDSNESLFLVSLEQENLSIGGNNGIFSNKSTTNDELVLENGQYKPATISHRYGSSFPATWRGISPYTHKRVLIKN